MPPLQPVPATARCVMSGIYNVSGGPWINVFHVRKLVGTDPYSQSDLDLVAAGVRTAYVLRFGAHIGSGVTMTNLIATDLTSSFGLTSTVAGSAAGTAGGTQQPPQCSIGVSWSQAQHFRGGHPRTYLPSLTSSQLASVGGNLLAAATATAVQASAAQFLADVNAIATTAGVRLVLVRRIANNAILIPPLTNIITGATVDRRIDTQRRRLGKDIA